MDEEEELFDELEELSPLNALDPEEVDKLTATQRKFLITFIGNGSISMSRKMCEIKSATWDRWRQDEKFVAIFNVVKSPPAFANALGNAIIWRAMLEHYKMFDATKESTRQWAVERAYALRPKDESTGQPQGILTQRDAKLLAESLNDHLSDAAKVKIARRQPFAVVEGEIVEVPSGSDVQ